VKPVSLESEGSQGVVERLADPLTTGVSPELLEMVLACTCMEELDVTFGASNLLTEKKKKNPNLQLSVETSVQ